MNKTELLALGLPEENLKEFQEFYHRDLRKAATRTDKAADELRGAIIPMLATIKDSNSLRAILATVTHHYLKNYREGKEETPCPTGESALLRSPFRSGRAVRLSKRREIAREKPSRALPTPRTARRNRKAANS